ncbi:MAG: type II/IV secretion system ATPase subunit [Candidatus Thermoplasmatota archaeon]
MIGQKDVIERLERSVKQYTHLRKYIESFVKKGYRFPEFHVQLRAEMAKLEDFNILYPVHDPVFIHVFTDVHKQKRYEVIEPSMNEETKKKYDEILSLMLKQAPYESPHETKAEFEATIERLLKKVTTTEKEKRVFFSRFKFKKDLVHTLPEEYEDLRYFLKRNILEHGLIEPLVRDPYIEDIHNVGTTTIHVVHRVFGMLKTNINFENEVALDEFLRGLSERIGKPVSDAKPIIDGSLPDGSRINIIYSEDVSKRGSSFTIRKFTEKPITMTQLVKWGTMSPEIAAYLWLCLEHGMSIVVSGETASGKTTSLNAMLTFVNHNAKVYTAEDTPEVIAPHPVWQRLVTREAGPEGSRVELFDLIRTALRSRPNYIVVGEVRGKEGFVMFQAMQTGHSVLSTFHAPSTKQMIQRFTGDPINVPIRFMDNLNVALFQQILYEGGRLIRRCTSVDEILRYSKELDGVMTRSVFKWDPFSDTHYFRGMNNSYILEDKIAPMLKLEDKRMIYEELRFRAKIIKNMVDRNILDYDDVNAIFRSYYHEGFDGIPQELKS